MKSKQLANVLIKIVGLYVCLCAGPGLVSGIAAVLGWVFKIPKWSDMLVTILPYSIGDAIQVGIGILLTFKSRKLAEFWFKHDED